jgi:hypothetical protein
VGGFISRREQIDGRGVDREKDDDDDVRWC